jgi:hypothetical protein
MTFANAVRSLAAVATVGAALTFSVLPSSADDSISASHLKAARAAIAAIKVTDQFDVILPVAAQQLKSDLIQKDPNLQDIIIKTVDEKTMALVSRRADLEKEAALAYARDFSEDELNAIAAFYNTPAGKKLIADGPIVMRKVNQAAEIWQRGIARDLAQSVGDALRGKVPQPAAVNDASVGAPVTAPAAKSGAAQK